MKRTFYACALGAVLATSAGALAQEGGATGGGDGGFGSTGFPRQRDPDAVLPGSLVTSPHAPTPDLNFSPFGSHGIDLTAGGVIVDNRLDPGRYTNELLRAGISPGAFSDFLKTDKGRALEPYLKRDLDRAKSSGTDADGGRRFLEDLVSLKSRPDKTVTIWIESVPANALATVAYFNNAIKRQVRTNGSSGNLFVGYYKLRVSNPNFKDGDLDLDLLEEPVARVHCDFGVADTVCHKLNH